MAHHEACIKILTQAMGGEDDAEGSKRKSDEYIGRYIENASEIDEAHCDPMQCKQQSADQNTGSDARPPQSSVPKRSGQDIEKDEHDNHILEPPAQSGG